MKITDHKLSEGIALTFRVPEGNIKHPLIILCHGFCGIRNVLLPCFANAFTEAGFATITFDYRGFGESDGERGRLVPAMQTEDIRGLTLSGTKTHVKQRFLPLTPLLMVSDVLWSPVLPA